MTVETYLLYLAALAVFFATPPDTSQLLIIANSARHGLKKSGWTISRRSHGERASDERGGVRDRGRHRGLGDGVPGRQVARRRVPRLDWPSADPLAATGVPRALP